MYFSGNYNYLEYTTYTIKIVSKKGDYYMDDHRYDSRWTTEELSKSYLEGVRAAIPLVQTQFDLIVKLVSGLNPDIKTVMDLGCGDGVLGRLILDAFPECHVDFVDFSRPMLDALKTKIESTDRTSIYKLDYSNPDWVNDFNDKSTYDLIISGFSIHHQPDSRKRQLYDELYHLLNHKGLFLHLEHVSSASPALNEIFDDYFIDHLFIYHQSVNPAVDRDEIATKYYNRPDKMENILAPIDIQCQWLRDIGFSDVDCYFKVFELSIFGGRKL